jgi:hypothetical protein
MTYITDMTANLIHEARYILRERSFEDFLKAVTKNGYVIDRLVFDPIILGERDVLSYEMSDACKQVVRKRYGSGLDHIADQIQRFNITLMVPHNLTLTGEGATVSTFRDAHVNKRLDEFALVKVQEYLSSPQIAIDIVGHPLSSRHVERHLFHRTPAADYRIIVNENEAPLEKEILDLMEKMPKPNPRFDYN